jgi:hypothetical protein
LSFELLDEDEDFFDFSVVLGFTSSGLGWTTLDFDAFLDDEELEELDFLPLSAGLRPGFDGTTSGFFTSAFLSSTLISGFFAVAFFPELEDEELEDFLPTFGLSTFCVGVTIGLTEGASGTFFLSSTLISGFLGSTDGIFLSSTLISGFLGSTDGIFLSSTLISGFFAVAF